MSTLSVLRVSYFLSQDSIFLIPIFPNFLLHIFSFALQSELLDHLEENREPIHVQHEHEAQKTAEEGYNIGVEHWDLDEVDFPDHIRQCQAARIEPTR